MEPNEQQFYELDDAGQPVGDPQSGFSDPSGQNKKTTGQKASGGKPWLRYVVVVLVLIIVALLAIWLVRALIGPSVKEMTDEEVLAVSAMIEDDLADCQQEEDVDYCIDHVWSDMARELEDPSVCLQIASAAALENCVTEIAYAVVDDDYCEVLEDQARKDCYDAVRYDVIVDSMVYADCGHLFDLNLGERCRHAIEAAAADQGNCAEVGVDVTLCSDEDGVQQALAFGNPQACGWLAASTAVETCYELFNVTDIDEDGLSLYDEYKASTSDDAVDTDGDGLGDADEINEYGTDPTDVDSDGDGYSDGEEVTNGFNPLGE